MKNLILVVFVAFISTSTFSVTKKPESKSNAKSELRIEIVKLLGNVDFRIDKNIDSVIEFMVNKKGEIIVLTVNSENALVDRYVKKKLNYHTVATKTNIKGKTFKIPLKIMKSDEEL